MDIEEWEFLSDDTFLDFNEDGDEKNYFSSSPSSREIIIEQPKNPRVVHNHLVPLSILLEPKIPMDVTIVSPSLNTEKTKPFEEADQETVSQVFFKLKENNEFVEMKMESPRSNSRVCFPQMDKGDDMENNININSPRMKIGKEIISIECDNKQEDCSNWEEEKTSGFNMLKWSLTGVGAICSFGVAVAAVCVMFFGTSQRNKLQQDHKIRFQIYADDKRIEQVLQHATKLNGAISVVRNVPMSSAHITIGGYYDGL